MGIPNPPKFTTSITQCSQIFAIDITSVSGYICTPHKERYFRSVIACVRTCPRMHTETRSRCAKVVFLSSSIGSLCHVRNAIMYGLSWPTDYALTRVLFWCSFPSLFRILENNYNKIQSIVSTSKPCTPPKCNPLSPVKLVPLRQRWNANQTLKSLKRPPIWRVLLWAFWRKWCRLF